MSGNAFSVHKQQWPSYNKELAADENITLIVQVNGKLRDKIEASATISEKEAKTLALSSQKIETLVAGKKIIKIIYVPARLINIVVS